MKKITLLLIGIISVHAMAQNVNGVAKGTIVTLADGIEVSIEEIKEGDLLLTLQAETNNVVVSKVNKINKHKTKDLLKVNLADGSELVLSSNQTMLSDSGWVSFSPIETKKRLLYESKKVCNYQLDTFVYSISSDVKIEILPIIEIDSLATEIEVLSLELDTDAAAYIANGFFVGQ